MVASVQVLGTVVAAFAVDRLGRRKLLNSSALIMALSQIGLGMTDLFWSAKWFTSTKCTQALTSGSWTTTEIWLPTSASSHSLVSASSYSSFPSALDQCHG